jgi:putative tryptophan/tyrosine transport system substrate-binding protein
MIPIPKGKPPSALPWIGPREAVMKVNDDMIEKFGLAKSAKRKAGV